MAGEVDLSEGFICLWRKTLDSPVFENPGVFKLWTLCLMLANWKDEKWLIPNTLIEIPVPRGSFITGRESLHKSLYPDRDRYGKKIRKGKIPNPRTTWRWLEALEQMGCIKLQNISNRCTLVTVCNYRIYQDISEESCPTSVQPVSNQCPTSVQPVSTTKPLNNSTIEPLNQKDNSADKPPVVKTPRPRDPLWDAIVSVTGADATLPKIAKQIGGVRKELLSAKPPYTPEEVLHLREIAPKFLPWSVDRFLTLPEVQAKIYLVRADPAQTVSRNGSGSKADLFGGMASWAEKAAADGTLEKEHGT